MVGRSGVSLPSGPHEGLSPLASRKPCGSLVAVTGMSSVFPQDYGFPKDRSYSTEPTSMMFYTLSVFNKELLIYD